MLCSLCTDGDGENHDVSDVDEWPDDADHCQAAGRHDVHVHQPVLEVHAGDVPRAAVRCNVAGP